MIKFILNLFFDEVVYVPIWLHERFHPDEPYEKDSLAIKNRHDVIQTQFYISFLFDTSFFVISYANNHGFVKDSDRDLVICIAYGCFVWLLSMLLIRFLKRTGYVENLMDKYFTYSVVRRKNMGYVWIAKFILLVFNPIILAVVLFA